VTWCGFNPVQPVKLIWIKDEGDPDADFKLFRHSIFRILQHQDTTGQWAIAADFTGAQLDWWKVVDFWEETVTARSRYGEEPQKVDLAKETEW
jgi:hypothetical protein